MSRQGEAESVRQFQTALAEARESIQRGVSEFEAACKYEVEVLTGSLSQVVPLLKALSSQFSRPEPHFFADLATNRNGDMIYTLELTSHGTLFECVETQDPISWKCSYGVSDFNAVKRPISLENAVIRYGFDEIFEGLTKVARKLVTYGRSKTE